MKDFMVNIYLLIRYSLIRIFKPRLFVRYSEREKDGLYCTFEDYFDEVSWDGSKWDVGESWGLIHPEMMNTYKSEPIIRDGAVVFFARYNPKVFNVNNKDTIIPFEVSWLSSHNTHIQKYGRWECRMTLPYGKAAWPAFWTWGQQWPPEIDIIEGYGGRNGNITKQYITIHYGHKDHGGRKKIKSFGIRLDTSPYKELFHEFAMEWTPESISFFTNGIKVFQMTNKKILDDWFNNFGGEHRTLINHNLENKGVHGTKYLNPDEVEYYYSEFKVDYIRIYQLKSY